MSKIKNKKKTHIFNYIIFLQYKISDNVTWQLGIIMIKR